MMGLYRISNILLALACGLFLMFILRGQVEVNTYSRVEPIDMPWFSLALMTLAAAIFAFEADMPVDLNVEFTIRLFVIIALTIGAVMTLGTVRFEILMPIYALIVMVLIGERRWYWLGAGIVIPVVVWWIVEILLERPLP